MQIEASVLVLAASYLYIPFCCWAEWINIAFQIHFLGVLFGMPIKVTLGI